MIALLEDVVTQMVEANSDRSKIAGLLYRTVHERAGVMHERAQRAESRAARAEQLLDRVSRRIGEL